MARCTKTAANERPPDEPRRQFRFTCCEPHPLGIARRDRKLKLGEMHGVLTAAQKHADIPLLNLVKAAVLDILGVPGEPTGGLSVDPAVGNSKRTTKLMSKFPRSTAPKLRRLITWSFFAVCAAATSPAFGEPPIEESPSQANPSPTAAPGKPAVAKRRKERSARERSEKNRRTKAAERDRADKKAPEDTARKSPDRVPANEVIRKRRKARESYRSALAAVEQTKEGRTRPSKSELKKARATIKRARDEFRSVNRKRAVRFLKLSPAKKKAFQDRLLAQKKKVRADRKKASSTRKLKLQNQLGKNAKEPGVRNELRRHTWRVARLTRLIDIAEAARRADARKRAERLLLRENERHQKRLNELLQAPVAEPAKGGAK